MSAQSDVLLDLESSVRRYADAQRAAPNDAERDFRRVWLEFSELGWLGAAIDEAHGGFGGPAEMAVIARELGAGLINQPYVETAVVPTTFLAAAAQLVAPTDLLAEVITGEIVIAAAFNPDRREGSVICSETRDGVILSGTVKHVPGANVANFLLVPAANPRGPSVVALLDCSSPGVHCESLETIDGGVSTVVTLDQVKLANTSVWQRDVQNDAAVAFAVDAGIVAQTAQMIGVMDRCFELTRCYLQARRQFGQPLAEFQVLRHRLADMYAELEQARALMSAAVAALNSAAPAERSRLASASKVRAIRASRVVGAQSIQLHGAIALTEEYEVGRCYTRLLVLEKIWGDLEFHVQRFMAASRKAKENNT